MAAHALLQDLWQGHWPFLMLTGLAGGLVIGVWPLLSETGMAVQWTTCAAGKGRDALAYC